MHILCTLVIKMWKIRMCNVFMFVLDYTIVFVTGETERLHVTLCDDSGNAEVSCPENKTIGWKSIVYGDFPCQNSENRAICYSNINTFFNEHCLGQNNCTLPTGILSNNSCQRSPRRVKVYFECSRSLWYRYRHHEAVETCANSLDNVYCSLIYHYINITNAAFYSKHACDNIKSEYCAKGRLKNNCNEKRRCISDKTNTSCLYHKRSAIVQYACTGPTDDPVTDGILSTSTGPTYRTVTESIYSTPRGTGRPGECVMNSSTISFAIQSESSTIAGIASTLVSIIVAAFLIIVIVCYRKKKAKISEPCRTANMAKEGRDSSDYDEMTYINILKIKKNINETPTKQNQPLNIKTLIEQDQNTCNKYESVSSDRNSVEHFYDSGSININQYESLTNPRESDKHTYESSEQALPQDITTSIEQEDNIGNKYESLSTNRNSVEHVYESDLINTNQYESLKKPRESDKHTYELAEIAQTHDIKIASEPEDIICNKYESLSTNRNSVEHTYESTEQTLPVSHFQSLTKPQESDNHLYSTTEY